MGRSPCCEKAHTNKGAWTREEDEQLIAHIKANGEGCWRALPKAAGLQRCGKSCRLRWINYLRPDLKRGNFTEEEDQIIIKLQAIFGNKWSLIAGKLPGRTDNEIKNYWNTHIKKKLVGQARDSTTTGSTSSLDATTEMAVGGAVKVDEKIIANMFGCKNKIKNVEEEAVNLELQISPPFHDDSALEERSRRRKKGPCFYCSLGVENSKDCSCYASR